MLVRWLTPDLTDTVTRFRDRWGFQVEEGNTTRARRSDKPRATVRLTNASIELVEVRPGDDAAPGLGLVVGGRWERLRVEPQEADEDDPEDDAPRPVHPNGAADLVAIGWATVDHERASGPDPSARLVFAGIDSLLGAGAWLATTGTDRRPRSGQMRSVPTGVVLEPAREGPLAAALARNGEGPAAVYVRVRPRRWDALRAELSARGTTVRGPAQSALGDVYLVRPERPWGPFLLFVRVPSAGGDAGDRDPAGHAG